MKNRILSYIIFFIALLFAIFFTVKGFIIPTLEPEKGEVKEAKMVTPVTIINIKKNLTLKKDKIKKDSNKTTSSKKEKETSNTLIKNHQKVSIKSTKKQQKELLKTQKSDKNLTNTLSFEDIIGVDPTKVKLHKVDDFNTTSKTTPLKELLEQSGAELGDRVLIRIFKNSSLLEVWIEVDGVFKHLKSYPICAYSGELGPKLQEGDKQAPEGFYEITKGSLNFNSKFHLAMNIGYPNRYDKEHNRTGSYIMIHGGCVSVGCFAMGDSQIEEIYDLVESALNSGQKSVQVQIYPFRMTQKELQRHSQNRWFDFWINLKEGYGLFEKYKRPLIVDVKDGNYTFR